MRKRLPKSTRKHIRKEKARIRREFLSEEEQNKKIQGLYEKLNINYNKKGRENLVMSP